MTCLEKRAILMIKKKEKESYLAKPKCVTLKKKNSFFFVCVRRHYPNEKKSRPARVCFFS